RLALKLRATRRLAQGCRTTVRASRGHSTPLPREQSLPVHLRALVRRRAHFAGNEDAYFAATCIHLPSFASLFHPAGSTRIQPFIGRPVRSNRRVCGCERTRSVSSGASRTMRSDL